jgi:hypothetical protein
MNQSKSTVTIDQAFQEFLTEQKARISPTTLSKYFDCVMHLIGFKSFGRKSFHAMEFMERRKSWNGDMRCVMRK